MASALLVHTGIIVLLLLVEFTVPRQQEEGGVPVLLGEVAEAGGSVESSLVEVDVMPEEVALEQDFMAEPSEPEMITQEVEETVSIPSKVQSEQKTKEPVKKEKPVKEVKKTVKPEKTAAEKAEEARKLAEAKAEKARREAEEAARRRVSGAFGKGAKMAGQGTSQGKGVQGNAAGNASTGKNTGSGGYGFFDLGGRSLGEGGLPRPVYNVQDEGKVVVDITVNPAGIVIATAINRHTNTVNPALRKAAEDAARKARFNAVSGLNNQQGTITYHFNLK